MIGKLGCFSIEMKKLYICGAQMQMKRQLTLFTNKSVSVNCLIISGAPKADP